MQVPPENEPEAFGGSFPASTPTAAPDPSAAAEAPIPEGRRVAAGRGSSWIAQGWRLFKEAPGSWVACFLIFVILMIVLAVIPLLGNIVGALLSPFLIAGMMVGCRELERNEELQVSHLFAGFRHNSGPLLVLGLLELALSLVVMVVAAIVIFLTVGMVFLGVLMGQSPEPGTTLDPGFWISALVMIMIVIGLFI